MNYDMINEIKSFVDDVLSEAKKKKKIPNEPLGSDREVEPSNEEGEGYKYAEVFDFSKPLDNLNLYRRQGQVNWGPHTGVGQRIPGEDGNDVDVEPTDKTLRDVVKESVMEEVDRNPSVWLELAESFVHDNPWQAASVIAGKK
jgi:hypothetical protein